MKSLKDQNIDREPFNLTMKQIKSDRYESAYKDLKQAERSSKLATEDVEDLIDITAELKRLTQPSAAERAMNTANVLFSNSMKLPKPKPQQSDLLQKAEAGRFATHADIEKAVEIYHRATESPDTLDSVFDATIANKFTERQLELLDDTRGMGTDSRFLTRTALQNPENNELVALLLDPKFEQAKYDKEHNVEQAQAAQKQSKDITAPNATVAAESKPSPSIMRRRP